mmetsp:Transcript_4090/g.7188  ORF Transcript_4090/g.7188 Transcript_4090/m.7188 type:complete len:235 (-) Transcript_4090:727-1431(-)
MGCFASKEADVSKGHQTAETEKPSVAAPAPAAVAVPAVRPKVTIDEKDRALLELKHTRDKLEQYKKRQIVASERQRETAKQLLTQGQKDRARVAMQFKKMSENHVHEADNTLLNIEKLIGSLEMTSLTKDYMDSVEKGNRALKELSADLDIDRIELLLEDTSEQLELQQEISTRLAQNPLTDSQQHDVEDELEALMRAAESIESSGINETEKISPPTKTNEKSSTTSKPAPVPA